jgi:hypothetical protein
MWWEDKGHGWQLHRQKLRSPQNKQPHQQQQPKTKAGQGPAGKQAEGKQPERRLGLRHERKASKEVESAQREERKRV